MSRRGLLLLLVLLVLGLVYVWSERPMGLGVARIGPGAVRSGGGRTAVESVVELAVRDLERSSAEFSLGRNLFSYGSASRPAPQPVERAQPPRPEPRPQPRREPRPPQPAGPKPPPVDVIYLGNFGPPGRRIAVFSDAEGVYNAQVGDVVKGKFQLVSIGYESVDLGFVGFPEVPPERLAVGRVAR